MLVEIKARMPHGKWLPWLEAEGVQPRTAQRLLTIASEKYDKLSHLGTADSALKAISDGTNRHAVETGNDAAYVLRARRSDSESRAGSLPVRTGDFGHQRSPRHLFSGRRFPGFGAGLFNVASAT